METPNEQKKEPKVQRRSRSTEDERLALIRAYAEHGMGTPPELETQIPVTIGDKKDEGNHPPSTHREERKLMPHMDPSVEVPNVKTNPSSSSSRTSGLGTRAIERTVDAGVFSVFAIATVTVSTLIVKKLGRV